VAIGFGRGFVKQKSIKKYGFLETGEITTWGSIDLIKMQKKVRG